MKRNSARLAEVHFYEWSVSRWKGSTTRMLLDAAGKGIYRELLDTCYTDGAIPRDPRLQALICGTTVEEIERVWPIIKKHFVAHKKDNSLLTNYAANLFRKSFFAYKKRQKNNGASGGRPKSNDKSDIETTGLPEENPNESQEEEGEEEGEEVKKESEKEVEVLAPESPPLAALKIKPVDRLPLNDSPFEQFCRVFTGPIEDLAYRDFARYANTPELVVALLDNTPLWMATKRYHDGFHSANAYLKSGVWKSPPKAALVHSATRMPAGSGSKNADTIALLRASMERRPR